MRSTSIFQQLPLRLVAACWIIVGIFGCTSFTKAAVCCACKAPGSTAITCLTSQQANTCNQILTTAKNPLLAGYVCDPKDLTAASCQTSSQAASGACKEGPFDAYSYIPKGAGGTPKYIARSPQLNIPIPGLQFADYATYEGGMINVPFLAQYIAGAYRYLVGISVLAAAVMIIYGGFRYIVGSSLDDVGKAKQIINDAIIGLLLVFSVYAILATINQSTLQLQSVKLTYINPVAAGLEHVNDNLPPKANEPGGNYLASVGNAPPSKKAPSEAPQTPPSIPSAGQPTSSPGGTGGCNPVGRVTYFAQAGGSWGSKPLGSLPACTNAEVPNTYSDSLGRNQTQRELYRDAGNAPCCMLYGDSACGPTSLAMVLASYGEQIDPGSAGDIGIAAGLRTCNSGGVSPVGIINARFPDYVYDQTLDPRFANPKANANTSKDMTGLDTALRSGHPVIFLCSGCSVWKKDSVGKPKDKLVKRIDWHSFNGHFMVLTGIYDDGNFAVNDPSRGAFDFISRDEVQSGRVGLIYIHRKDNKPITACSQ